MSDKPKFPRADALKVAKELCEVKPGSGLSAIIPASCRATGAATPSSGRCASVIA